MKNTRESVAEIIYRNLNWKFLSQKECEFVNTDEVADKILTFIISHLLNEIKKVRENYVMYEIEPYEKDIIKIINNLYK